MSRHYSFVNKKGNFSRFKNFKYRKNRILRSLIGKPLAIYFSNLSSIYGLPRKVKCIIWAVEKDQIAIQEIHKNSKESTKYWRPSLDITKIKI